MPKKLNELEARIWGAVGYKGVEYGPTTYQDATDYVRAHRKDGSLTVVFAPVCDRILKKTTVQPGTRG